MQSSAFVDFTGYFRQLATKHKKIKYFVHGPGQRILTFNRSKIQYPCLWLETPTLIIQETDSDVQGWNNCAFVIFTNAKIDSIEQQDQMWSDMQQICLQVLARIRKDRRDLRFRMDFSSVAIEAISTISLDNEYGWRVEFRTDKSIDLCVNPEDWED